MATYAPSYYADRSHSRRSAERVLPELLELIPQPASAVDVGCGSGDWLAALADMGCGDLRGIEGDWARTAHGDAAAPIDFRYLDLSREMPAVDRRFDLAISLEVAEHLPETRAGDLIDTLTAFADIVLFSAAIPGQQGVHHVNEQWQSYWAKLFLARGFYAFDPIRPRIAHDRAVDFWYRQNVVLYAADPGLVADTRPIDRAEAAGALDQVSPDLYLRYLTKDRRRRQPVRKKLLRKLGLGHKP